MDSVNQLRHFHPWISSGEVRLLIISFHNLFGDEHTADSFCLAIGDFINDLCYSSEERVKNIIAMAFESTTISRADLALLR